MPETDTTDTLLDGITVTPLPAERPRKTAPLAVYQPVNPTTDARPIYDPNAEWVPPTGDGRRREAAPGRLAPRQRLRTGGARPEGTWGMAQGAPLR